MNSAEQMQESCVFECTICLSDRPSLIKCSSPTCDLEACHSCWCSYILTQTEPRCMKCLQVVDDYFVRTKLPKSWVDKQYKAYLKNQLVGRETSYMPESMVYYPVYQSAIAQKKLNRERKPLKTSIKATSKVLQQFKFEKYRLVHQISKEDVKQHSQPRLDKDSDAKVKLSELNTTIKNMKQKIDDQKEQMNEIKIDEAHSSAESTLSRLDIRWRNLSPTHYAHCYDHRLLVEFGIGVNIYQRSALADAPTPTVPTPTVTTFSKKCIDAECRGFLNENFTCKVCSVQACSKCMIKLVKDSGEHVCNQADVDTLECINRSTKPCPKCQTRIERISGCDHMFCTHCHTGFCWRTGLEIDDRSNTNPHFRDFMNRNRPQQSIAQIRYTNRPRIHHDPCTLRPWRRLWDLDYYRHISEGRMVKFRTQSVTSIDTNQWPFIAVYLQYMIHDVESIVRMLTLQNYTSEVFGYNHHHNRLNRLKWINKDIDDKLFAQNTLKVYKKVQYNRHVFLQQRFMVRALLNWLDNVIDNLYFRPEYVTRTLHKKIENFATSESKTYECIDDPTAWDELMNICHYCNQASIDLANLYGYSVCETLFFVHLKTFNRRFYKLQTDHIDYVVVADLKASDWDRIRREDELAVMVSIRFQMFSLNTNLYKLPLDSKAEETLRKRVDGGMFVDRSKKRKVSV